MQMRLPLTTMGIIEFRGGILIRFGKSITNPAKSYGNTEQKLLKERMIKFIIRIVSTGI